MINPLPFRVILGQAETLSDKSSGIGPVYFIVAIAFALGAVGFVRWHQARQLRKARLIGQQSTGRIRERDRPMRALH